VATSGEIDTAKITLSDSDTSKWGDYTITSPGIPIVSGTFDMTWETPISLKNNEVVLLRALAKLLVDTDLFNTLMSELGIDEDAALVVAFRGQHG
jgi:hypothetical protein